MKHVILAISFLLVLVAGSVVHAQAAQLTLSFTDNSANETGFQVERCQGTGCTSFVKIADLGVNTTTYVDSGLVDGTTYCYRVRAVNAGGASPYTNVACATTLIPAPAAPTNLVVK